MAAKSQRNDSEQQQNDITTAYQMKADLNELAGKWEQQMKEAGGSIGANVEGSRGPSGNFQRGWHVDGTVEVGRKFTIPMDVPAWMVEQMKADFEAREASVDIDMSTSVAGRPPKINDAGNVIPRGPSQERIDAMEESEKTHTGVVEVTLDVTEQMQGLPEGMIIEGARCSHRELGVVFVKSLFGSEPEDAYVVPEDSSQVKGTVAKVNLDELDLLQQFPEETEQSAWWWDI